MTRFPAMHWSLLLSVLAILLCFCAGSQLNETETMSISSGQSAVPGSSSTTPVPANKTEATPISSGQGSSTTTVPENTAPTCQEKWSVSVNKTLQESREPLFCPLVPNESPCSDPDSELAYVLDTTGKTHIFSVNKEKCLMLRDMTNLDKPIYCLNITATELGMDNARSAKGEICITFNTAPTFGDAIRPDKLNIRNYDEQTAVEVPVETMPDDIKMFKITEVLPPEYGNYFSVQTDNESGVLVRRPHITNATELFLTVEVTDDGNPPLSSSKKFPFILYNDTINCSKQPNFILVDVSTNTPKVKRLACYSTAGNGLVYNEVHNNTSFAFSISNNGTFSLDVGGVQGDYKVNITIQSIFNLQKNVQLTFKAGLKPSCNGTEVNLSMKDTDPAGTTMASIFCYNNDSTVDLPDIEIPNATQAHYFELDDTEMTVGEVRMSVAIIKLKTVFQPNSFPDTLILHAKNKFGMTVIEMTIAVETGSAPSFVSPETSFSVLETAEMGTTLYQFTIEDPDNTPVILSINSERDNNTIPFSIQNNRSLVVTDNLNASSVPVYILNLSATDTTNRSVLLSVTVTVNDTNDRPLCSYVNDTINVSVDVTAKPATSLVTISCFDVDVYSYFKNLTYTLATENTDSISEYFKFNESNPSELLVSKSLTTLNLQNTSTIEFRVNVSDQGSPPLFRILNVRIQILDTRPVCARDFIEVSITEKSKVGHCFNVSHQCVDPMDSGLHFQFVETTSPSDGNFTQYFELKPGQVSRFFILCLIDSLDGKPGLLRTKLNVSNNVFQTAIDMKMVVKDVNEAPKFEIEGNRTVLNISEKALIGTEIGTVNAIDRDLGKLGHFTYSVNPTVSRELQFHSKNGTFSVKQNLNATVQDRYEYNITATDTGGLSSSVTVIILVDDVNELPVCQDLAVIRVNATARSGHVLGKVKCWDPDLKQEYIRITYRVSGDLISVSEDGQLTLIKALPLNVSSIPFQVKAANPGQNQPSATSNVTLRINTNFPPECNASKIQVSFNDSATSGTCGDTTLLCTNPLQRDLTWAIKGGNLTGSLTLKPDGQPNRSLSLKLCTNKPIWDDLGYHYVELAVTNELREYSVTWYVTVEDINEAPYFQQTSYVRSISENVTVGTILAKVQVLTGRTFSQNRNENAVIDVIQVTDPDRHTYPFLINSIQVPETFQAIAYKGKAFVVIDKPDVSRVYLFTIRASDGGYNATAVYNITVTDVNEPPTCTFASVQVNTTLLAIPGTPVLRLNCSDPDYKDEYKAISYFLRGSPDSGHFRIDSAGTISIAKRFDRTSGRLTLQAVAGDTSDTGLQYTVDITVWLDRNISAVCNPVKEYPKVWVIKSCMTVNLSCTDPTTGDSTTLTYKYTGNYTSGFNLTAKLGFLSLCYTRTGNGTYQLLVEVDNGLVPTRPEITIEVVYLRSTPKFKQQSYSLSLSEDTTEGATVLQVTASTEGHFRGIITYSITETEPATAKGSFLINGTTGWISTVASLTAHAEQDIVITVMATDGLSNLKSTTAVTIHVNEINIAPECSTNAVNIKRKIDVAVGNVIYVVSCTDKNIRRDFNTIKYRLKEQSRYFGIHEGNGTVFVKALLPLRTEGHHMEVYASDGENKVSIVVVVEVDLLMKPQLSVSSVNTTAIGLQWSFGSRPDYTQIIKRFMIFMQEGNDANKAPIIPNGVQTKYTVTNLIPGTIYVFQVVGEIWNGNVSSNLKTQRTPEIPVLTKMMIQFKVTDKDWDIDLNNEKAAVFLQYKGEMENNIIQGLMGEPGIHMVNVIGFSNGSINVDAVVVVNQSGNVINAGKAFQDAVKTGSLGGAAVAKDYAVVNYGDSYATIKSLSAEEGSIDNIIEDTTIRIACSARMVGVGLSPIFKWNLNGNYFSGGFSQRVTETVTRVPNDRFGHKSVLSFSPILQRDQGNLNCMVSSRTSSVSTNATLELKVIIRPTVRLQPLTAFMDKEERVNLTCTIAAPKDKPVTITWYKNNNVISNKAVMVVSKYEQVLQISSVVSNATYQCVGENIAGATRSNTSSVFVIRNVVQKCKSVTDTQGIVWPSAPAGGVLKKDCQKGSEGIVSRVCGIDGQWQRPKYTDCRMKSLIQLAEKAESVKDGLQEDDTEDIVESLVNLTASRTLVSGDIHLSMKIMENVVEINENKSEHMSQDVVEGMVKSANNILNTDDNEWKDLVTQNKGGASALLKTMDKTGHLATMAENKGDNSEEEIYKVIPADNLVFEYGKSKPKDIELPNPISDEYPDWMKNSRTKAVLKAEAYTKAVKDGNLIGFVGVYYRNLKEIVSSGSTVSTQLITQAEDEVDREIRRKEVNSRILSFSLNPRPSGELSPQLFLQFEHLSINFSNPSCGYLDFSPPYSDTGRWSTEGCDVVNGTENTTACGCSHFTNFAVLMSPGQTPEKDAAILSIISAVGCGISIFCLTLTICAYVFLWRYVKSDRAIILINLCVALIVAYIVFLVGVTWTQDKDLCTAFAALLHYVYLAVFCLMLAEGVEVLVNVIYVFNTKSRLALLLSLSWGFPAVVVAISLGVTRLEGYGNSEFCWLTLEGGLLWAFVGPALVVIMINFVIVLIVLKTMFSTTAMMTKSAKEKGRAGVKAICVLLPVMGLTWVFGVFSVNEDLVIFQYLFAVFNSLQGLFIFIFHCIISRQVRDGVKNRKRRYYAKTFETGTKSTSSAGPPSKIIVDDETLTNDLDKKSSPFIEADRQVQQIEKKLAKVDKDNFLVRSEEGKKVDKGNLTVEVQEVKVVNLDQVSTASRSPPGGVQRSIEKIKHGPLQQEETIEEYISQNPTEDSSTQKKSNQDTVDSSTKKRSWRSFSRLKRPGSNKKDTPKSKMESDTERKLQERRRRIDQVYGVTDMFWEEHQNKKKTSGQAKVSKGSSEKDLHRYKQRAHDLPLYRGKADENWGKVRHAVEKQKHRRQPEPITVEPQRRHIHSHEDLSKYGYYQPFGGVRMPDSPVRRLHLNDDATWEEPDADYW